MSKQETPEEFMKKTLNGTKNFGSTDLSAFYKSIPSLTSNNTKEFAESMQKIIKGLCTCGTCRLCYLQRKNLGLGADKMSTYKEDFPEHPLQGTSMLQLMPRRNNKKILSKTKIPMISSQKLDFVPPGYSKTLNCKPDEISNSNGIQMMGTPFPGGTNYKTDYIDWKQSEPVGIIRPSNLDRTKFKLPFIGKGSNNEYGNFPMEETMKPLNGAKKFGKSQYENPLGPSMGFNGNTNYKDDYVPFKLDEDAQGDNFRPKDKDNIANSKKFNGRFTSTYKDYDGNPLKKRGPCPAKKLLGGVKEDVNRLGLEKNFKF